VVEFEGTPLCHNHQQAEIRERGLNPDDTYARVGKGLPLMVVRLKRSEEVQTLDSIEGVTPPGVSEEFAEEPECAESPGQRLCHKCGKPLHGLTKGRSIPAVAPVPSTAFRQWWTRLCQRSAWATTRSRLELRGRGLV